MKLMMWLGLLGFWGVLSHWSYRISHSLREQTRYELQDLQAVLTAALATNPADAKIKIAYVVEELRKLT